MAGIERRADQSWLTPRQAAEARGLTERFVRRLIENGKLPTSRPNGWRHFVNLADLDSLLEASRVRARTGPLARRRRVE